MKWVAMKSDGTPAIHIAEKVHNGMFCPCCKQYLRKDDTFLQVQPPQPIVWLYNKVLRHANHFAAHQKCWEKICQQHQDDASLTAECSELFSEKGGPNLTDDDLRRMKAFTLACNVFGYRSVHNECTSVRCSKPRKQSGFAYLILMDEIVYERVSTRDTMSVQDIQTTIPHIRQWMDAYLSNNIV